LGALDGKHVAILCPSNSGSLYYNYKHFFSVVLLALVDANYKFIFVDIGCYGRSADGGVYSNSSLSSALNDGSLKIPNPENFNDIPDLPFVIVADDAFALKPNMLKPYGMRGLSSEQKIFNYRLSRSRRVVENAFGILTNRFRVFSKPIPLAPHKVEAITMAACCLHNFLMRNSTSQACYVEDVLETAAKFDRSDKLSRQGGNRSSDLATEVRNKFTHYFNTIGSVPWQSKALR
jgi:hypothetical protein